VGVFLRKNISFYVGRIMKICAASMLSWLFAVPIIKTA